MTGVSEPAVSKRFRDAENWHVTKLFRKNGFWREMRDSVGFSEFDRD